MQMPLEDVKILDLSHALAGPFCSTMLGDFGAQVIKVEVPGAGDIARAWGPPFYHTETAYFVSLHRNKQSIELDLKHPAGKEVFFRLVEQCDVVLENYRVGTLDKLGIGYDTARQRNPGIIYCSVSGFGQDGPYRDRAALDLIVQAESGMISITGEPGGRGVRCGVSIADMVAGMYAAFGIMNALRVKDKTGKGQYVDVSMLEGQLGLLQGTIGAYLADGELPQPMGTAYKALLPYQTFRTRTRDLALAVGSERLWRIFCPLMGLADMLDDPRYANNAARNEHRDSPHRQAARDLPHQALRRVGSPLLAAWHSGGRHQYHRYSCRASPDQGQRRPGRMRASRSRQGQDRGCAGETVRDAWTCAATCPLARPAYG